MLFFGTSNIPKTILAKKYMTWWGAKMVVSQDNNLTSIPLMMEKPAKRPRVPPMTASWSMNVVFESFVIRSNVGLLMKMVTRCKVLSASHPKE